MRKFIHKVIRELIFKYYVHTHKSVTIFNFHQVSQIYDPTVNYRSTWTNIEEFKRNLNLLKIQYDFIPLTQALRILKEGKPKINYAVLTFDDGHACLTDVVPILEELNIPATFFINSGYLDDKAYSWVDALNYISDPEKRSIIPQNLIQYSKVLRRTTDSLEYNKGREFIESYFNQLPKNKKRYLTTDELFSIQNPLISIGLHGYEHQRASMMSESWNRENIRKDIEILAKHPNYVPVYAIPFGRPDDWNEDIIKIALENQLDIMLHNGGYNLHKEVAYNRIAADGLKFELGLNLFQ